MKFTREIVKPKYDVGAQVKFKHNLSYSFGIISEIDINFREKQIIKYQIHCANDWSWHQESDIIGTFTMDGQDE